MLQELAEIGGLDRHAEQRVGQQRPGPEVKHRADGEQLERVDPRAEHRVPRKNAAKARSRVEPFQFQGQHPGREPEAALDPAGQQRCAGAGQEYRQHCPARGQQDLAQLPGRGVTGDRRRPEMREH